MKRAPLDIAINSLLYAIYMLVSCVAVMFAEMLAVKIVDLFIVVDYFWLCVIRAVIYTLCVNALLAAISFYEGFRSAEAAPAATAISAAFASVLHCIFALLFSFDHFCAGGVRSIAILVKFGTEINSPLFDGTLSRFEIIPFFFINSAVYIAVMVAANALGAKKRRLQRQSMNIVINDRSETQK